MKQILVFIIFVITVLNVEGQSNYGSINYSAVLETLPEYSIGLKNFESTTTTYQDSLNVLMDNYYDFIQNGGPHNVKLSADEMKNLTDHVENMESRIQEFQIEFETVVMKNQENLMSALKEIIEPQLELFCSQNNIECMVDSNAILICNSCTDYTDQVIKHIKNNR